MGEGRLEVKGYSSGDWYRRIFANRSVRSMAQTVNGDTVGSFDLGQEPVEEGTGEIREWDCTRHVDGGIQRELGTLDEIEDDRVLKTYQGIANITQVKGCFWIEQIESHACSQYRGRKGINEIKTRPRRDEWAGRDRKSPVEWTRRGSDQPALCRDAEPSTWQRTQNKKKKVRPWQHQRWAARESSLPRRNCDFGRAFIAAGRLGAKIIPHVLRPAVGKQQGTTA